MPASGSLMGGARGVVVAAFLRVTGPSPRRGKLVFVKGPGLSAGITGRVVHTQESCVPICFSAVFFDVSPWKTILWGAVERLGSGSDGGARRPARELKSGKKIVRSGKNKEGPWFENTV